MVTVLPVVPMRILKGSHQQLEYRVLIYKDPDTGVERTLAQSRVKGSPWGVAVELEVE